MSYYFNSVIEITLPITAFICLMLLLSPFIKKTLVIKWRYFVWLFISIRLLLPFPVQFIKPVNITVPQSFVTATNFQISESVSMVTGTDSHFRIGNILFYLWIIICLCIFCINIFFYVKFNHEVRKHKNTPSPDICKIAKDNKIPDDIIIICNISPSPMVFGIIKPLIILPHEDYSYSEINMILKHESVHYKNKDVLYKCILLFARCMHWFNPFVYIMYKMAIRDLELCCDYEVVKGQNKDFCAEYCHVLISAIRKSKLSSVPCSTNFEFSKNFIKERISSIFDKTHKRKGKVLLIGACFFVLLCGGIIEYTSAKIIENTAVENIVLELKMPEKTPIPQPVPTPYPQSSFISTEADLSSADSQASTQKLIQIQETPIAIELDKPPVATQTPMQTTVPTSAPQKKPLQTDSASIAQDATPIPIKETSAQNNAETIQNSIQPTQTETPIKTETQLQTFEDAKTPETTTQHENPVSLKTSTMQKAQSSYSIEKNSMNITVTPDMDSQIIPIEFIGNEQSILSVGCISGECGYRIVDAKTGNVVSDNSAGEDKKASAEFNSSSSYFIQVFTKSEAPASIYVYKE